MLTQIALMMKSPTSAKIANNKMYQICKKVQLNEFADNIEIVYGRMVLWKTNII